MLSPEKGKILFSRVDNPTVGSSGGGGEVVRPVYLVGCRVSYTHWLYLFDWMLHYLIGCLIGCVSASLAAFA